MSRLPKRVLALAAFVAAGFFAASCDSTRPPFMTDLRVAISAGSNVLGIGQSAQAIALARFSDGEEVNVTNQAVWHSTNQAVITITPPAVVVALTPGTAEARATYAGRTGGMSFRVQ